MNDLEKKSAERLLIEKSLMNIPHELFEIKQMILNNDVEKLISQYKSDKEMDLPHLLIALIYHYAYHRDEIKINTIEQHFNIPMSALKKYLDQVSRNWKVIPSQDPITLLDETIEFLHSLIGILDPLMIEQSLEYAYDLQLISPQEVRGSMKGVIRGLLCIHRVGNVDIVKLAKKIAENNNYPEFDFVMETKRSMMLIGTSSSWKIA